MTAPPKLPLPQDSQRPRGKRFPTQSASFQASSPGALGKALAEPQPPDTAFNYKEGLIRVC